MNISFPSNNTNGLAPFSWERVSPSQAAAMEQASLNRGDQVSVRQQARLLDDSEVEGTLADTIRLIGEDTYSALHAHSGLDPARVAALLA